MMDNIEPAPLLRVTVGSSVYTSDYEQVGKVKEVRDQHFKVETGLLQRDYWIHERAILEAAPGESVTLAMSKDELNQHKIFEEPQAAA